jgi:hypothetical protein
LYLLLHARWAIDTKAFVAGISERGRMGCERRVLLMVLERREMPLGGVGSGWRGLNNEVRLLRRGVAVVMRCGSCDEVRLLPAG